MANVQLFSDLHLEFLQPYGRGRWLGQLEAGETDILILAGDICLAGQLDEVLTAFCEAYPEVVYVTGNHEYYGTTPATVRGILWDLQVKNKNLHVLENEAQDIGGLRFVGGTMWFPKPGPKTLQAGKWQMNDYMKIGAFEPWVYEQNALCVATLKAMLPTADVVVTHHLPSVECISPRYRSGPTSTLNHFFCHDLTELIREKGPTLWCFGHTHDRMSFEIGATQMVCNAKGYPHEKDSGERGDYIANCIMKVSPGLRGVEFVNGAPGPGFPGSK